MSDWLDRIRTLEPARVRAVWVAVVALLVSIGVTINTDLDGAVQALIVAVFTVLPLIQGESTRAKVTPVAVLEDEAPAEWLDDGDDGDDMIPVGE
jgi:hypothetical protein